MVRPSFCPNCGAPDPVSNAHPMLSPGYLCLKCRTLFTVMMKQAKSESGSSWDRLVDEVVLLQIMDG